MNFIRSQNTAKIIWTTLLSLMLISSFAASGMKVAPVKAVGLFTLHATETENPDWGYYGGYHPIWAAIIANLSNIGIDVVLNTYGDFDWYDRVWSDLGWNVSWSAGGGWDMFMIEWWLQPHAPDPWFVSMIHGDLTPDADPEGYNIHPYTNDDADDLLDKGMHYLDAVQRQTFLHLWQEEFMRDPPQAGTYYPKLWEVVASWVSGWDSSGTWWYDTAELTLDSAMLTAAKPSRDNRTLIYLVSEYMAAMSPMFMDTYTDENAAAVRFAELYKWSTKNLTVRPRPMPDLDDYVIVPDLAADFPKYLKENSTQPNGTRVRVPLRKGMVWSDGQQINATDVKWTFDTCFAENSKVTGLGDFAPIIKSVEIVDNHRVDFILYEPYPDILSVLANDWGTGSILPWHQLKDIGTGNLKAHATNTGFGSPDDWIVASGPFQFKYGTTTVNPGTSVTYEKNPNYFGYNASIVGTPWGPYNVDTLILKWVPEAAARLIEYQNYDADFGEYSTAPVATYKGITDPYLTVYQYDYPAGNPIWFNFNNQYLSNRYIRMAICHALPYTYIIGQLLDPWGIETAWRGKTYILPQHYYTDENNVTTWLFNDALQPYAQDAVRAQKYMDLWENSLVGGTVSLSPSGDADFNGLVDLDDFYAWRENWGLAPPFAFDPGHDIDPDWTNNAFVDMLDFYEWQSHFGDTYP